VRLRARLRRHGFLGAVTFLFLAAPLRAQGTLTSVDFRLPTDGAGAGTIAARITFPSSPGDARYPDGVPVIIYLPGGFGAGGLAAGARLAQQGFAVITFIYPGGQDGASQSDGVYDYRGDNCQRAVRDVIRFAEGQAADGLGRTIADIVPMPVLTSIVGLAPYSNGLIGLITLDRYGAAIPRAPYQCGWENPTSGQIINGDLGTRARDCDASVDGDGNGVAGDDGNNPWYDPETGYGPASFTLDFSRLAFDPVAARSYTDPLFRCAPVTQAGMVFHDGRSNGRLDFNPALPGCLDFDGDGIIESVEDFQLTALTTFTPACALKLYYSREVTHALEDLGVFPGAWPAWIATPAEADARWPLLDVTVHWAGIAARFPDLRLMTTFTRQDHVQSQDDHPHVRQVLDGTASRSFWYRLNADAWYYEAVNGSLPAEYVETPANSGVPPAQMKSRAEPIGTNADAMQAAGHAEMADRIYSGCWWPDLTSGLRPALVPDAEAAALRLAADRRTLDWSPAAGAFCYDVLRASSLADDGQGIRLDNAACVAEDSPVPQASDPALPPAGTVYFYVVKPNGIHGTYGAGSSGRPRLDAGRACR